MAAISEPASQSLPSEADLLRKYFERAPATSQFCREHADKMTLVIQHLTDELYTLKLFMILSKTELEEVAQSLKLKDLKVPAAIKTAVSCALISLHRQESAVSGASPNSTASNKRSQSASSGNPKKMQKVSDTTTASLESAIDEDAQAAAHKGAMRSVKARWPDMVDDSLLTGTPSDFVKKDAELVNSLVYFIRLDTIDDHLLSTEDIFTKIKKKFTNAKVALSNKCARQQLAELQANAAPSAATQPGNGASEADAMTVAGSKAAVVHAVTATGTTSNKENKENCTG